MEIRIYSWQNEGDVCEHSIQWIAYFTSKKEGDGNYGAFTE